MRPQQTLAGVVCSAGQALHLGMEVRMRLLPAPPDSGLLFRRVDLPGCPVVRAASHTVVDTRRCVTIGTDGWRVGTVEHLLAAAHALGLDNAIIEIDGAELPVGDGSALHFARLIEEAGLVPQDRPRLVRRIAEPIWLAEEGSYLFGIPAEQPGLTISYTFSADARPISAQYYRFRLGEDDFLREIAPARTIAFLEELEALRREGLAQVDDMDLAVVVGPDGYVNRLRLPDEIVRHKILDLLGDLFLLGPVQGQIVAIRSGHRLNHLLTRKLEGIQPVPLD